MTELTITTAKFKLRASRKGPKETRFWRHVMISSLAHIATTKNHAPSRRKLAVLFPFRCHEATKKGFPRPFKGPVYRARHKKLKDLKKEASDTKHGFDSRIEVEASQTQSPEPAYCGVLDNGQTTSIQVTNKNYRLAHHVLQDRFKRSAHVTAPTDNHPEYIQSIPQIYEISEAILDAVHTNQGIPLNELCMEMIDFRQSSALPLDHNSISWHEVIPHASGGTSIGEVLPQQMMPVEYAPPSHEITQWNDPNSDFPGQTYYLDFPRRSIPVRCMQETSERPYLAAFLNNDVRWPGVNATELSPVGVPITDMGDRLWHDRFVFGPFSGHS
ncbi:hypothetical protein BDZ97DRAFT_1762143 [Flammula alnicola]|nr:hypothetical protein BDZ97DRAFT_1762143 [Flammula alnicola]